MRITIIDGHPDPSPERLNHALADRYAQRLQTEENEVRRIDVARLNLAIVRTAAEFNDETPTDEIAAAQQDIAWADHIVFFFPLWLSDMPAYLKAFIEQAFRPGFALERNPTTRFPRRLLAGRSARIVVTMRMPAAVYRTMMGAHMLKMLRSLLLLAGIAPMEETIIGGVMEASEGAKRRWFDAIDRAADRDMARGPRRIATALRAVAGMGALAAAGYLAFVVTSWSRYGVANPPKDPDTLLDRFMPDYEVALRHASLVHAPASTTFSVVRDSDLERSPIVRLLFGARETLLRGKTDELLPTLPFEQLTSLGWSVLAVDPGKEIVLGTVTKPWDRDSRFRAVPGDEFPRFNELGYAKIAVSVRIEPISSEHCELRSETRVQTTDPISRGRFRRYWALLSPGMEIIRRVMFQQVKTDAESAREKERAATDSASG